MWYMIIELDTRTRWPISNAGLFSASDAAADESTGPGIEDEDDDDAVAQHIGLRRRLVAIGADNKNAGVEFIGAMVWKEK